MPIFVIIMIAVSLSMDAFSLSLAYGTLNLTKKDIYLLSGIVGIYHFFMPILGMCTGLAVLKLLPLKPEIIVFIVLFFIGIEMIIETFKEKDTMRKMGKSELLLFGLAVSLDSFSVGIGLKTITSSYILSSCIFSCTSCLFTYLGLVLGKKIHNWIGKISTIFGGLVLILLGLVYLF